MKRTIRIGTRSSKLALAQTRIVSMLISSFSPSTLAEIVPMKTRGDRLPEERKTRPNEKAAFTGDLERKLASGDIDVAVHSLKDLPNELHPSLKVVAVPKRGDPRDALVSPFGRLSKLGKGAKIGTSSIRRKVQVLRLRDDIEVVPIHGNVETRIDKISRMGLDGVVLAAAGLERIGENASIAQRFSVTQMVPAVGQGIIAVEARGDDAETAEVLRRINDKQTKKAADCERAFSLRLGSDCYVPVGAFAKPDGKSIKAVGFISSSDGNRFVKKTVVGSSSNPVALGRRLADELLRLGGDEIMGADP